MLADWNQVHSLRSHMRIIFFTVGNMHLLLPSRHSACRRIFEDPRYPGESALLYQLK